MASQHEKFIYLSLTQWLCEKYVEREIKDLDIDMILKKYVDFSETLGFIKECLRGGMQIFVKSKSGTNYPKYMPQSYSSVFGMTYDQRIHDQDHVQDLDSWQSSDDFFKESRMKQSRTMLDLSLSLMKLMSLHQWHWYQKVFQLHR